MKVLFIGDSITKGTQGVDWVKMLEKEHPYWNVRNAGANGETFNKIADRLTKILDKDQSNEVVVLQGGINDVLLPTFKNRNFWFKKAYQHQIKSGNKPFSPSEFEVRLRTLIEKFSDADTLLILSTLTCINENLLAETNALLFSYNSIIKKLAKEYDCILADIADRFQKTLTSVTTQDYCLDNFSYTTFIDPISSSIGIADSLSKKRKLHLTIDGVHLNSKGAEIYRNEIEKAIMLTREKSALFI